MHVHAFDLPVEQFEDLGGDGGDRVAVGEAVEQDDELVAAPARHGVFGAHRGGEAAGHVLQHEVAAVVAETVVDALEAVEVDEQHRHHAARAGTAGDRPLQPVEQQAAVGQPGEGVVGGFVAQPLGGGDALGDVVEGQHRAAFVAGDGGEGQGEHVAGAVGAGPGQGRGQRDLPAVGEAAPEELAEPGGFGGEAAQQGPDRLSAEFGQAGAEQPPGHRVHEHDGALAIDGDHPVGDGAQGGVGLAMGPLQVPPGFHEAQHQRQQVPRDEAPRRRGGGHPHLCLPEQHAAGGEGQQQPAGGEGNP